MVGRRLSPRGAIVRRILRRACESLDPPVREFYKRVGAYVLGRFSYFRDMRAVFVCLGRGAYVALSPLTSVPDAERPFVHCGRAYYLYFCSALFRGFPRGARVGP